MMNIEEYPVLTKEQKAFVRSVCANRKTCPKTTCDCNPGCFAPLVYFF